MSDDDKSWLSTMLCAGMQVTFMETKSMWIKGKLAPFEQNAFPFKCELLMHADDRVRLYFHQQAINNEELGGFISMIKGELLTAEESADFSPVQQINFKRNKDYSTNIEINMINEFKDLTAQ